MAYSTDISATDTYQDLQKTKKELKKMINKLPNLNRKLAKAEREYRMEYTKKCVEMHINGLETEEGRTDEVAWSTTPRLVKGVDEVAEKKYKVDILEGDKESVMQRIYKLKKDIDLLQKEMESIQKGE